MTCNQVMKELKMRGTAQNVKVYQRRGSGDHVFGVSCADLKDLKKRIKLDHALALELWDSGNVDAQSLATMIVDPAQLTASVANKWIAGIRYFLLADLASGVVARTTFARSKMGQWMKSKKEYPRQCGYNVLASLLVNGDGVTDNEGAVYLKTIEREIHASPNRARHAMNMALIAIGIYCPALTQDAVAAAKRIGKVAVDHGETACKTPDAIPYIEKALKRKK